MPKDKGLAFLKQYKKTGEVANTTMSLEAIAEQWVNLVFAHIEYKRQLQNQKLKEQRKNKKYE